MREGGGVQYAGGLPGLASPRGKSAMRLATVVMELVEFGALQKLNVTIMLVAILDACQAVKNVKEIVVSLFSGQQSL